MEKSYKTKQRSRILDYIKENKNAHITADTIIDHFKKCENPVSKATVYRYLDNLVEENIIRKFLSPDANQAACYQYVEDNIECEKHYHMKCTKCGNLVHLDCDELIELSNHILKEHKFKLDPCRTILYGVCENCMIESNI